MDTQSRPPVQSFNPYIGAFFALAGLAAIFTRDYVVSGAFFSVSAAFFVYWRDTRPWAEMPRAKRLAVLGLIFLGAVFLVVALISSLGA